MVCCNDVSVEQRNMSEWGCLGLSMNRGFYTPYFMDTSRIIFTSPIAPKFEKRNILLVPWLHIVKTVYKRIFACKLTNNICVIILVRCCGPHLLFATRLHTSCLGWCRSVRRRTHHVTPRRTRVWRVRRWTTPSQY